MADRPDLPSPSAPNFDQRIRETLMVYLGRQGNPLDRGLTVRDLIDAGVIQVRPGFTLNNSGTQPPIEPGPGNGGDAPPDYTAPPMPTGFSVIASLTNVFIEHDNPTYTQGRGHLRTRVFGAKYIGGALPTIANAIEIGQFTGTVFVFPSDIGTTWRLWIRWESRDGVIGQPAGGTNGLESTTGKIGNVDLGPLIVEAVNIANNAIEEVKIADNAISAGKISANAVIAGKIAANAIGANNIIAGTITGDRLAAATITGGRISANTITAANIATNTITGDRIAGNTITGDRIASNTITANNLSVNTLSAITALIGLLRTASSGARLELSDNVIKVFDSAGNLRVKIGNLSL